MIEQDPFCIIFKGFLRSSQKRNVIRSLSNRMQSFYVRKDPTKAHSTSNRPWTRSESFSTSLEEVIPFFSSGPGTDQRS